MWATGVYPASVTAFDGSGALDLLSQARLLARFEAAGCAGVVLGGTNGEGPSLGTFERRELVREAVPGSLRMIVSIAADALNDALWLAKEARKAGADALLAMPPRYFAGEWAGVAEWFDRLLDKSDLPVFLYNFPRRCGVEMHGEQIARWAGHPKLAGAKDSSGEAANIAEYREALPGRPLFVGDETLLLSALENGWQGTISGAANLLARDLVAVVRDYSMGEVEQAQMRFEELLPVLKTMRSWPQPATHKRALAALGVLSHATVRAPLLASNAADPEPIVSRVR